MRAVGGAEGVVDIDIGERRERPRKRVVVFLLAGVKTDSLIRLDKVVTLSRSMVSRRLGKVGPITKTVRAKSLPADLRKNAIAASSWPLLASSCRHPRDSSW